MKIAIAGGGILGALLAYKLSLLGHEIKLFEKEKEDVVNCSMTAAGLLTPFTELDKSEPIIADLGIQAIQNFWPEICKQLEKTADQIYFKKEGALVLSHPRDQKESEQYIKLIQSKNFPSTQYYKLNASQVAELEPELAQFSEGYFFPEEGQIDNQQLLATLFSLLKNKCDVFFESEVTHVKENQLILNNEICHCDLAIDCRGLGAVSNFHHLRGIRGELIWLHAPFVNISRPIRLMHPRYSLYLAPRQNQTYILGASEIESENRQKISVRSALELLSAVYYLHRGFGEAIVLKTLTHCRPTLPDHLPKIKYAEGFLAVNGLYRHGFLIAPALVHAIEQYIHQKNILWPQLWEKLT